MWGLQRPVDYNYNEGKKSMEKGPLPMPVDPKMFCNLNPLYVMKKIAVVHCGKVIIIIKYYHLSHDDENRDVLTAYC